MNLKRIVAGTMLAALASALLYVVLAFLTDASQMLAALRAFPPAVFAVMLMLSAAGFVIRGVRWGALMRVIGFPVSTRDAMYLQFSGQAMAVTPGRIGELFKPWLASAVADMPMSRGIALVFSERLADLIAVCILSLGALTLVGGSVWALVAALSLIVIGTWVASSAWFHERALTFLCRHEWSRKHHAAASAISATIRVSLRWRTMLWSIPASALAWGLEGIGFSMCLNALGYHELSVVGAVSIHAIATIIGALTFLPGGIGVTEASMVGILVASGMDPLSAGAATMITRVATLWWGVTWGWIAIATRPSLFRKLFSDSAEESAR